MNSFFMSLSNEAEEVADHTIFQHTDPWIDSNTHPSDLRNYNAQVNLAEVYLY